MVMVIRVIAINTLASLLRRKGEIEMERIKNVFSFGYFNPFCKTDRLVLATCNCIKKYNKAKILSVNVFNKRVLLEISRIKKANC